MIRSFAFRKRTTENDNILTQMKLIAVVQPKLLSFISGEW